MERLRCNQPMRHWGPYENSIQGGLMSVRDFSLEPVPSTYWLKRRKAPAWLLEDISESDGGCRSKTNDNMRYFFTEFNNLGTGGNLKRITPGCYPIEIKQIPAPRNGTFPRWELTFGDYQVLVTKAAADQWRFIEMYRGCEEVCIFVTKTRATLLYLVADDYQIPPYPIDRQ